MVSLGARLPFGEQPKPRWCLGIAADIFPGSGSAARGKKPGINAPALLKLVGTVFPSTQGAWKGRCP